MALGLERSPSPLSHQRSVGLAQDIMVPRYGGHVSLRET